MEKYIVYEENSLQQVSKEVDTPLDARYLAENFQESAKRYNLKNKKYKWTTVSEFNKKLLLKNKD